jgi:hypothetical protein
MLIVSKSEKTLSCNTFGGSGMKKPYLQFVFENIAGSVDDQGVCSFVRGFRPICPRSIYRVKGQTLSLKIIRIG